MILTFEDVAGKYIAHPDLDAECEQNIRNILLPRVNGLALVMEDDGVEFPIDIDTGSGISGSPLDQGGGNGGWRPPDCPVGAPKSAHKWGLALDRFDPWGRIDAWCLKHLEILKSFGIHIEHPDKTIGWSHWQAIAPRSGRIVFWP